MKKYEIRDRDGVKHNIEAEKFVSSGDYIDFYVCEKEGRDSIVLVLTSSFNNPIYVIEIKDQGIGTMNNEEELKYLCNIDTDNENYNDARLYICMLTIREMFTLAMECTFASQYVLQEMGYGDFKRVEKDISKIMLEQDYKFHQLKRKLIPDSDKDGKLTKYLEKAEHIED